MYLLYLNIYFSNDFLFFTPYICNFLHQKKMLKTFVFIICYSCYHLKWNYLNFADV